MTDNFNSFSKELILKYFPTEYSLLGDSSVEKIIEGIPIKSAKGGNNFDFSSIVELIGTLVGIFKSCWDIKQDLDKKNEGLELKSKVQAIVHSHKILDVLTDDQKEKLIVDISILLDA